MNNPTETQAPRALQFAGVQNTVQMPQFIKFSDLEDQHTIAIHIGSLASSDPAKRKIIQRAHNDRIVNDNAIDPEQEPELTLYVRPSQLDEGGKLHQMADKDATKKVIVHVFGQLHHTKLQRLVLELSKQAPHAEIYRGVQGANAEPWGEFVEMTVAQHQKDQQPESFPLVAGYAGFDRQSAYLVKGLIPAESMCSIYGPSGSYKSFAAVSLACHIATGKEWDGRRVEEGAVLYIAGEGGPGVSRRIRAWCDQYNGGQDVPNFYRIDMPVFMADGAQIARLNAAVNQVKEATGQPVRMIVVDTVARCFGGADENRAADMGAFINGCDTIKALTKAAILLVHHTGKNEDNGARGSSAFRAALDAEFLLKREAADAQAFTLLCTKMKDGDEPGRKAYDMRSRVVCFDDEGDEVTSLVVIADGREPVDPDELEDTGNLSSNHKALFQAIRAACEKLEGPVKRAVIIEQMKAAGTYHSNNGSRWFKKLIDERVIGFDAQEKTVWVLGGDEE